MLTLKFVLRLTIEWNSFSTCEHLCLLLKTEIFAAPGDQTHCSKKLAHSAQEPYSTEGTEPGEDTRHGDSTTVTGLCHR